MKIAVLSDIHANLEALTAVLAEADRRGADAIYHLGDVVGYGPEPKACLDLVRARCAGGVLGNHDAAVAHVTSEHMDWLPRDAQEAAQRHHDALPDDDRRWLADLPLVLEAEGCTFAHASPGRPRAWLRLETYMLAREQFEHFDTRVCFVGHTHRPAVMADKLGVLSVKPGAARYLVNVGSVGQPRDQDARAAFGLYDTEAVTYELVRVPYNTARTAQKLLDAGYPSGLASRLENGR